MHLEEMLMDTAATGDRLVFRSPQINNLSPGPRSTRHPV
jgi:hypothetical protein